MSALGFGDMGYYRGCDGDEGKCKTPHCAYHNHDINSLTRLMPVSSEENMGFFLKPSVTERLDFTRDQPED